MSLIHEALKKAEAQRRLGEPPTLGSPVMPTRRPRRLLPFLLVAIAIAGGYGLWEMRRPGGEAPSNATASADRPATGSAANPPSMPPGVARPATGAAVPSMPADGNAAERRPQGVPPVTMPTANPDAAATAPHPAPATTLAERTPPAHPPEAPSPAPGASRQKPPAGNVIPGAAQPPPAAATAAGSPPAPPAGSVGTSSASAAAATPSATAVPGAPASALPPPGTNPPASATAAAAPARNPPTTPAAGTAAPSAGSPPAAAGNPAAASANAATAPPLPRFWELPYAQRKALPALSLSMHVYASDPKQRFVVLNGSRQIEGDSLGSDVTVQEIRPDGVVLDLHGTRFLLPRLGN